MNQTPTSMPDWLRQRAASTPERLALVCGADRVTCGELDGAVDVATSRLIAGGVEPGHRVALLGANSTSFVVAVHAVARAGSVLVPLNLRLTPAELAWQLTDSGASTLLFDAQRAQVVEGLIRDKASIRPMAIEQASAPPSRASGRAGVGPARAPGPSRASGRAGVGPARASGLSRASARAGSEAGPDRRFDLAATHSVIYTSGTTGRPKGAMLTYGNHFWSAVGSALNLGLKPEDRWLACLPLFHVGGLAILLRSAIYGTTAIVHESFDAARANAAIDEDGVTIVSVVANMLQRMLAERGGRPYPAALRCVLLGGGPAPEPLLRDCEALGVPVVQTYGLTESSSQVATLAPEDALRKLGSAGKPLFGSEVRIEGEEGRTCKANEPGEIVVRGPTVTPGYLNRPDDSARVLKGGWLHTGDIGYLDAEGYLYVLDRRDDLIVSGGENVYPAEIEAVLQSHADVSEAGVYGEPHERWGQAPAAVVVLATGASTTAEALVAYCRERLAAYKTPSRIVFATSLPRNAAGKLVRSELRKQD